MMLTGTPMKHFCSKMCRNDSTFVIYVVKLSTYMIPNSLREIPIVFAVTVGFTCSPVAIT